MTTIFYIIISLMIVTECFSETENLIGQGENSEKMELSRRDLVEMLLERNQGIKVQKLEREISEWNLQREMSIFEPEFVTSVERQKNERQNTGQEQSNLFPLVPTEDRVFISKNYNYTAGIEGLLPLGTRYSIQSTVQDLENDTNNFNSEYVSFAGINIQQPLLQGAGFEITTTGIRIANVQTDIALQEMRRQLLSVVANTEGIYWRLVAAQEENKLRTESVAIARKILIDNEKRVKAGKMSDLEVDQAATGLEIRLRQQQDARLQLLNAVSELRSLIADTPTESSILITAIDEPDVEHHSFDYNESVRRAYSMNPDYLIKKYELDQEDIRVVFAENQRKPKLDLTASYGLNGLGDSPEETFQDIKGSDFETWTVGIELRMALGGGKRAKAELQTVKLRKRQKILELKEIEVQVDNRIDNITDRLAVNLKRIESYDKEVAFNERLLKVELSRLSEGKSDSRKVLELEEDLFDVKSAKLTNLINFQVASIELELIEGTLLKNRNIELVQEPYDKDF